MATRKSKKHARRTRAASKSTSEGNKASAGKSTQPPEASPAATPTPAIPNILALATLCLLIAVSYFPATQAGFVWDDVVLTGAKPLQSIGGLWEIWFEPRALTDYEGHYWPILYTTFWLEHRLWGVNPLGYHIVSVLLHMAVTLLLWHLLRRLAAPGAWVVAAVFAVHPLHVESVVWVIGRKDLLATLFYLAAALCYIRFVQARRWRRYAGALILFVLSLLSKAIAVTLPVSLLIWHGWKQGRITGADLARVLPFALLGLCVIAADLSFYKGRDPTTFDYSLLERALIAAQALWFYAGKLLWPSALAVIYPRWEVGAGNALAWGCLAAAVAVAALLWFYRRRIGRGALAGALFFAVTLAPTLGFVDYGYMLYSFVADRYQYLAGAGVIAVAVGAGAYGVKALPGARVTVAAVVAVALVVLGTLTWRQAGIYRDSMTFYSHIIALNPQARFAHASLATEYQAQGRYEEALAAYQTDYRLALKQPAPRIRKSKAMMGMGKAMEALKRPDEAEVHYRNAVKNSPRFSSALDHLGAFYINQRRYEEALEIFQALNQLEPGNAKFYVGKGVSLVGLKRFDEALQSYDRALAIDPAMGNARSNRENLLKRMGGG